MMDRHRTDFVELLFGLLFVAAGAGFVVHQTTDRTFDAAWISAIAFVTVGVAFLSVTLLHRPRSETAQVGAVQHDRSRDPETPEPAVATEPADTDREW
jgi:hypothetical protein